MFVPSTKNFVAPTPRPAFCSWAVFADFDGATPDLRDFIHCASGELAEDVVRFLSAVADYRGFAPHEPSYEEGWCDVQALLPRVSDLNHKMTFHIRESVSTNPCCSWDEVLRLLEERSGLETGTLKGG